MSGTCLVTNVCRAWSGGSRWPASRSTTPFRAPRWRRSRLRSNSTEAHTVSPAGTMPSSDSMKRYVCPTAPITSRMPPTLQLVMACFVQAAACSSGNVPFITASTTRRCQASADAMWMAPTAASSEAGDQRPPSCSTSSFHSFPAAPFTTQSRSGANSSRRRTSPAGVQLHGPASATENVSPTSTLGFMVTFSTMCVRIASTAAYLSAKPSAANQSSSPRSPPGTSSILTSSAPFPRSS